MNKRVGIRTKLFIFFIMIAFIVVINQTNIYNVIKGNLNESKNYEIL